MSTFLTIFCYLFILVLSDENGLSQEERDLIKCCYYNKDCCNRKPTNFEVKAVLMKCRKPSQDKGLEKRLNMITVRKERSENFDKEPKDDINICKKKMKITVKIKNVGLTNLKNQYILIDHVFDAVTGQNQKLFMPYILKVVQQPILERYGMVYESLVNAEAKETVYNKDSPGYKGCDNEESSSSSCKSVEYKNQAIPYSKGFCCPCKSYKNEQQLPVPLSSPMLSFIPSDYLNQNNSMYTSIDQLLQEGKDLSNVQIRGNQECNDQYSPPNISSEAYQASSHCLNYSNIWYSVYRLEKPVIQHSLTLEIFQKYQTPEIAYRWKDLTKKIPMEVGTDVEFACNMESSATVRYFATGINEVNYGLDYKMHKLLIPDCSEVEDIQDHPELKGGPEEYLVVKSNRVQPNGKVCNVAGVGYEAFAKQPNRCSAPKGSCLKNQPIHMWQEDKIKETKGKKGEYFLKYFGVLPDQPIYPLEGHNRTLYFFFTKCHSSTLKIEFKDDENTILRANSLAIITEVYVDGTNSKKTTIIAKIFNSGLVSSVFYVSLAECPLSLPASFSQITSMPVLIPPQHQHVFNLNVQCPIMKKSFFCSLLVLNTQKELIAVRKIRLERAKRCICVWYCVCACYSDHDDHPKCDVLSLLAFHATGFQGSMPVAVQIVEYSFTDNLVAMFLYVILTLCLTLLLMGLIKGLLGICVVGAGLWGLDVVLDLPRKIGRYYERDLRHRCVRYNDQGWPIHPDTGDKVRNIPLHAEFCFNLIFFIIYPFCVLHSFIRKKNLDNVDNYRGTESCYCKGGKSVKRRSSGLQPNASKRL